MSYQNFSNPPAAAGIATSSTTVVHSGQPVVVASQPMPYNPFAAKAGITKKFGIIQVVMGTISIVLGVVMIPVAPMYFGSISGGGIWSGIFIIVAGSLCIAAGSNPDVYGTRCGALTMCIISILFLTSCGILNIIGFAIGVSCVPDCYWDYYQQRNICYDDCEGFNSDSGPYLSLVLFIMMLVLFVITLLSAIYTGRGCCSSGSPSQGYVMTQPVAAPGGVIVSNYQGTANQGGHYHQQGYAPPSTGYPPSSTGYQQSSTVYPPSSTGYPSASTGYLPASTGYPQASSGNQPYPSQQYTQTSTAQAGVTYGVDYSQQKAGDPTSLGEAPPPYNPNQ